MIRPGYPQRGTEETEAAARYRRDHDAAHLDGLLPEGPQRRRRIAEPHGWILGLALNDATAGASPLVVWEESHRIMRAALMAALTPHDPADWGRVDITDAYTAARREVFARCRRIAVPTAVGEATLLHRLVVHGVAPWGVGARAPEPGRIIAYFRPQMASVSDWLTQP